MLEKRETRDGSITYFNSEIGDAYHSITVGAIEEAVEKYVKPTKIKDGMRVLDFCFGLGYNSLAVLMENKKVEIVCLERDENLFSIINELKVPEKYIQKYEIIKKAVSKGFYKDNFFDIKIVLGDARISIENLDGEFDVILFDPFSPSKTPEMWGEDVFRAIYKKMQKGGVLTTYSCARWIRDNMRKAGFIVEDGICLGRKSPSTIAIKK